MMSNEPELRGREYSRSFSFHGVIFNSNTLKNLEHFGNRKNENLLRGPKFYGENEFLVEMCIS